MRAESAKRRSRHDPRAAMDPESIRGMRGHLCPGPEWAPDEETCGRMLPQPGRCSECSERRTRLRKAARAAASAETNAERQPIPATPKGAAEGVYQWCAWE